MPKSEFDKLLRPLYVALALVVFMVVGAIIAGGFFITSLRANDRAIVEQRREARFTVCRRDNQIRTDAIAAARAKAQDFIDANKAYSGAGPSTGKLLDAERAYVESQGKVTADAYPLRDCTEAGITAYYENPPAAVDETCEPDGKGLCK